MFLLREAFSEEVRNTALVLGRFSAIEMEILRSCSRLLGFCQWKYRKKRLWRKLWIHSGGFQPQSVVKLSSSILFFARCWKGALCKANESSVTERAGCTHHDNESRGREAVFSCWVHLKSKTLHEYWHVRSYSVRLRRFWWFLPLFETLAVTLTITLITLWFKIMARVNRKSFTFYACLHMLQTWREPVCGTNCPNGKNCPSISLWLNLFSRESNQ